MGNYLNHGAALGNAIGFKLSSLWKINEFKVKKENNLQFTLLNFIAQVVFKCI